VLTHAYPSRLLTPQGEPPKTILIFRALQVGDMLCAVPALRALRLAFPEARITLAGLPWAEDFVRRFAEYLDDFIIFPGYPGLPERAPDRAGWPSFIAGVRGRKFDAVIQMHGSGSIVNALTAQFGAKVLAGFFAEACDCPDPERFMRYPEGEPEIWRHLRLMEFLGVAHRGDALEFPLLEEDEASLRSLLREHALVPGDYVCVHPGARARARRWSPSGFAAVADRLAARGARIVLTGSAAERDLTENVARQMRYPALNLAGPMPLGTLAALIGSSRLLVSNDTGVSHIAAGLGVPSVIVFTGSDPKRWAPLAGYRHRAVYSPVPCRPVTTQDVLSHIEQLTGGHLCAASRS
jgi:ADP-heptose:LPS heptosyltransferase